MKPSFRFFLPATGWLILSTILLTLPGSAFPTENWFSKIWFDKWVHIGMFGIMAVLVNYGLYKMNLPVQKLLRYFIIAGLCCLGYGIIMEFVQKNYIPNRSFDTGDIVADAVGCLAGLLFSRRVYIKK